MATAALPAAALSFSGRLLTCSRAGGRSSWQPRDAKVNLRCVRVCSATVGCPPGHFLPPTYPNDLHSDWGASSAIDLVTAWEIVGPTRRCGIFQRERYAYNRYCTATQHTMTSKLGYFVALIHNTYLKMTPRKWIA